MNEEGQVHTLNDGAEVLIRPMTSDDCDRSISFFQELPKEEVLYLRVDVTDPDVVRHRLDTNPLENVFRVVALHEGRIVADATLRWPSHGWMSHVGEIRVIIAKELRRRGLSSFLYRQLFVQAVREGLEKIEAYMIPQQESAIRCVDKLGFKKEGVLPNFVKDISGGLQDLIIMSTYI